MMAVDYVTSSGRPVRISRAGRLGGGGEGQVLRLQNIDGIVAKLFHQPTAQRKAKIEYMARHPLPESSHHCSVAWPRELIFHRGGNHSFAGYLMWEVKNAWPVFACYNLLRRRSILPGFSYRHLLRTARNLAAAVDLVHRNRCVIGDLNESNVLVSPDALTSVIDADSFQLADHRGKVHRCGVAKSDFLAPELQSRNLAITDRRPCQDNFALGILIFKLLAEGAHPFDGCWLGGGVPSPLEARIASGELPHRSKNWRPKPLGVPFGTIHPALQHLFIQCFERGRNHPESRPDAEAWRNALWDVERELRLCRSNPYHFYWGSSCTWCNRSALLDGIDPFPPKVAARPTKMHKTTSVAVPVTPRSQPNPWSRIRRILREFLSNLQVVPKQGSQTP